MCHPITNPVDAVHFHGADAPSTIHPNLSRQMMIRMPNHRPNRPCHVTCIYMHTNYHTILIYQKHLSVVGALPQSRLSVGPTWCTDAALHVRAGADTKIENLFRGPRAENLSSVSFSVRNLPLPNKQGRFPLDLGQELFIIYRYIFVSSGRGF